jgi:hypothetical protein
MTRVPRLLLTLSLLAPLPLHAADDETMKPAADTEGEMASSPSPTKPARAASRPTPPAAGQRGALLERLRENADKLGLSDDQRKQLETIARSAREKARDAVLNADGDREKARRRTGEIARDAFERVRAVLTAEQQRKMREVMNGPDKSRPEMDDMMGEMSESGGGKTSVKSGQTDKAENPISKEPVDPATLQLKRIDGKTLTLSALKGKPVVLVFGSASSPTFRDHAAALDDLARKYAVKAHFVMIYTREAHPTGGWEVQRNKDAELSYSNHKTEADRLAAAKQVQSAMGLRMPFAVDTMDDSAVRAFHAFPNGCVILDREGRVAARQKWAEPARLRSLLDQIVDARPTASTTKSSG